MLMDEEEAEKWTRGRKRKRGKRKRSKKGWERNDGGRKKEREERGRIRMSENKKQWVSCRRSKRKRKRVSNRK